MDGIGITKREHIGMSELASRNDIKHKISRNKAVIGYYALG